MNHTYKDCQSCGMPLKRDSKGGGTNADGSTSAKYCSHCFINGTFTHPEITTAVAMQALVANKMATMGFPRFITGLFTKKIPKLERWRPNA